MQGVIYQYETPIGKKYIGQTLCLQRKRIDKHKFDAYTNMLDTPFARAIRKYGWETIRPTYQVIETLEADDRNDLKRLLTERENHYIEYFDTLSPNGYNVQVTNQTRLGVYRDKKGMYRKISSALKGKYLNEANPSSRRIINFNTKEIYPSISEASRQTGILVQAITTVLKSKNVTAGGFRWCYVNDDGTVDESNLRPINRKQLPVYCVELDKTFVSAYEAAKYIGKPMGKANIRIAAEKGVKRYGLTFKYVDK